MATLICTFRTRLYVHEGMKEPSIAWYFRPFEISTWLVITMVLLLFTCINTLLYYIMYRLLGATKRAGLLSNLFTFMTIMLQQGKSCCIQYHKMIVKKTIHTPTWYPQLAI